MKSAKLSSWLALAAWLLVMTMAQACAAQIEKTPHNFAAGAGKDGRPANPCTFCHTPHNGTVNRALWNHSLPGTTYKLYESPTLKARVEQPTGASRLCLSCHDGTIALEQMQGPARTKAAGFSKGKSSLSKDLSDDHPISFRYDSTLALNRGELTDPAILSSRTRLDEAGEMQCTTCHDPHQEKNEKFLVVDNRSSQLCRTCHQMRGWQLSLHATSTAQVRASGLSASSAAHYSTVAENGCASCHRVHSAGRPHDLLNFDSESKSCFSCHTAGGSAKDLQREFRKFSAHPLEQSESIHNSKEDPRSMSRHVACSDCH
ncbi:MAG TPA: cytochrome c3 family protein, partial [Candidatus Angelobacter sp.]